MSEEEKGVFGTKEWAESNHNIQFGCENNCLYLKNFKDLILFRFTIGSTNNDTLKFWEPDAPPFLERFDSVRLAKAFGFDTSISCEPMLDDNIQDVVEKLLPSVTDSIWIGKANDLTLRLKLNKEWNSATQARAEQLLAWQADRYIFPLYEQYKDNPKIKWKESIKKVVGLKVPTQPGLDI